MLNHEHSIAIGDWSCDGHNQCDYIWFKCSHSKDELVDSIDAATKRIGVSFHGYGKRDSGAVIAACCEYEDSTLSLEAMRRIEAAGVKFEDLGDNTDSGKEKWMDSDSLFELLMRMTKVILPDLEWKVIERPKAINVYWKLKEGSHIGYGLFHG